LLTRSSARWPEWPRLLTGAVPIPLVAGRYNAAQGKSACKQHTRIAPDLKDNHPRVYRETNKPNSYSEASSAICNADSKSEKFTRSRTSVGNNSSRLLSRSRRAACRSALSALFLQGRKLARGITPPEGEPPPSMVRKTGLLRSFTGASPRLPHRATARQNLNHGFRGEAGWLCGETLRCDRRTGRRLGGRR
jgi:hypothetical protein